MDYYYYYKEQNQNLTILFRTVSGTFRRWGQWISKADEWLKITGITTVKLALVRYMLGTLPSQELMLQETIRHDDYWRNTAFNIVATLIQMVATFFQHCNAVLYKKSSLRIVPCNIALKQPQRRQHRKHYWKRISVVSANLSSLCSRAKFSKWRQIFLEFNSYSSGGQFNKTSSSVT